MFKTCKLDMLKKESLFMEIYIFTSKQSSAQKKETCKITKKKSVFHHQPREIVFIDGHTKGRISIFYFNFSTILFLCHVENNFLSIFFKKYYSTNETKVGYEN
jgi:hypothetical protein